MSTIARMSITEIFTTAGAILASIGIGGGTVAALSNWLGKVWAERLMEKERSEHNRVLESDRAKYAKELEALKSSFEKTHRRLQNELDKTLFGHQLTVQTEFDAMKEIWKMIPRIRTACYMLRASYIPLLPGIDDSGSALVFKHSERYLELSELSKLLDVTVETYGPFMAPEIHVRLSEAALIARSELIEAGPLSFPNVPEWCEAGKKNSLELNAKTIEIQELIRARLEELSRLESDGNSE